VNLLTDVEKLVIITSLRRYVVTSLRRYVDTSKTI